MSNALTTLPAPQPLAADSQPASTELALGGGTFGHYPLAQIRISKTNRKRFNITKLNELAASIKAKGVAQPILIRPVPATADEPQTYEIVAGERRFRASIIAGLTVIPAMCRELSDMEALELQILENLQRDDPHPLEEAEGYERLMMKHGYNADQLAERLDKSRSYIYGRLKLCALNIEVREQFLDNEEQLPASTALLIARIPVPALQTKALNEILRPNGLANSEPMSHRRAKEWLQQNYMLDLRKAIFLTDDAKLVKTAGSCNKCPKRAGNQPVVFEGVEPNTCTDPDCFKEKTTAHHGSLYATAVKQGIPIHEGEEAFKVWSTIYRAGSELVSGETPIYTFERVAPATGMSGTVATRMKGEMHPAVTAYARGEKGDMTPLHSRAALQSALEAIGVCETVEAHAARLQREQSDLQKDTQERSDPEAERTAKIRAHAKDIGDKRLKQHRIVRGTVALNGLSLPILREMAKLLVRALPLPTDLLGDLYPFEHSSDDDVCAYIDTADRKAIEALMLDLAVGEHLSVCTWEVDEAEDSPEAHALTAMSAAAAAEPESTDSAGEIEAGTDIATAPPAAPRTKLTLKPKGQDDDQKEADQSADGPVVKVKKTRIAIVPAEAWPFPKQ